MKDLLQKLQGADEAHKRRWIVVFAAIIMVVVIYIWLAYFNNFVAISGDGQPLASNPSGSTPFWQSTKDTMASLSSSFMDELHSLGGILQTPRDYIVKPPQ